MFIVVEEVDLSRNSLWCSNAHLFSPLGIYIKLEVFNRIMIIMIMRILLNNLSILMNLNVWSFVTIFKSDHFKSHHVLSVFNLHKNEFFVSGFKIFKETMKFLFFLQWNVSERVFIWDHIIDFLSFIAVLERNNIDLVVIGQDQIFFAQPNVAN